jgi:hypothetical protein
VSQPLLQHVQGNASADCLHAETVPQAFGAGVRAVSDTGRLDYSAADSAILAPSGVAGRLLWSGKGLIAGPSAFGIHPPGYLPHSDV